MGAYKDKTGTWYAQFRFTNWKGEPDRKTKRGFATKKEALDWERDFLTQSAGNLEMTFEAFYELYKKNLQDRLKKSTWKMKTSVIESKILPYFKKKRMCDIKPRDIVAWQNVMLKECDADGNLYSPVYLKTIHNQLSAIFNHAVKFYELDSNPAAKVGDMGKEKTHEMLFWTKGEYLKFAEAVMDKPISFYAFEVLYWCGLRLGELLALTPADFDLEKEDMTRFGVIAGSAAGGLDTIQKNHEVMQTRGYHKCSPFMVPMMISNMAAGKISIHLQA